MLSTPSAEKNNPVSTGSRQGTRRSLFRSRSLVARIVRSILFLSVITAIIVPAVSYFLARQSLQESIFARLEVATTLKDAELKRWVDDNVADIYLLAGSYEFKAYGQQLLESPEDSAEFSSAYNALSTYLSTFLLNKPNVEEILILSERNGKVVLATISSHQGDYRSTEDYYLQGRENTYVQNIYTSLLTGELAMTIATPMFAADRLDTVGVLVFQLNLDRLDRIISERTGLGETGETYLINRFAAFVSETRYAIGEFPSGVHTPGIDMAIAGVSNQGAYPNYQGIPVLGVYRWIPDRQLVLVTEISQAEAFAPATRLAATIFGASLLAVALLAIGAVFVARQIARPIIAISNAAQRVAGGDFDQPVPVLAEDETGILANSFNQMTVQIQELVEGLEARVADRTQELEKRAVQLQAAAEVGKAVASTRDLDELLQQVTNLISERFDYYHVGIFLLDSTGENAVLRASNSIGGRRMMERGHALAVGQKGIVGYVTGNREPRIAMDVGQDAVFFDNPDLPATRSEMALPLIAGGKLLGALDVQSTMEAAFTQDDIATLQVLADQVAIAIENANLFAETQNALEMTRRAYGEVSRQAWEKILRGRPTVGYVCDRTDTVHPITTGRKVEAMQEVLRSLEPASPDPNTLLVPFKVHGRLGGMLRLRKSSERSDAAQNTGERSASAWSKQEIDLIQTLSTQLSTALESAQLYSDSQRRAIREQLIGQVTATMRESLDVDEVLRTAVLQMRRALSLAKVEVRLQPAAPGEAKAAGTGEQADSATAIAPDEILS